MLCYTQNTLLGETHYYYAINHILSGGTIINMLLYIPYPVRRNIIIILHTHTVFCQEEYYYYPTYSYSILLGGILLLSYILVPYLIRRNLIIIILHTVLVPYFVRRNLIIIILHTRTVFCWRNLIIIILHTRTVFCQEEFNYYYPTYSYSILSGGI